MPTTLKASFSRLRFVLLVALIVWIKTYTITLISFDLKIETFYQNIILFISPLASSLFIVGLSLFFKGNKRNYIALLIDFILTFILCANVLFYGFFNDFITLPVLFQTSNMGDLGSSIKDLASLKIIFMFLDIIILFIVLKKFPSFAKNGRVPSFMKSAYYLVTIAIGVLNLGLAEVERPELLTRSFDREMLVKNLGLYFYQAYDLSLQTKTSTQKAFADSGKLTEVENYVQSNQVKTNPTLFGKYKGKNVIVISLESTQSFAIGAKVNGKEITPFLNQFIKGSYYFSNFYHQTGQGKTSDAEFLVDNSLYPLDRGAVFFTHANNEFMATPEILKDKGYYSAVFHANNKSFWNRNVIYPSLGYDRFFNEKDFVINDENSANWGLKDIPFFEQSMPYLTKLKQPFYTRFITLSNHYPFTLDPQDKMIDEYNSGDETFDRYVTTLRYEDEAIKHFIDSLKESGLYDNSIIVMYGDHYGISENHNRAMAQFLGKDAITPFDHMDLQRTPLIIHLPKQQQGENVSTPAGEIDVKPTILHLLGVDTKNDIEFGKDLFSKNRPVFTIFRDGSFVTDKYYYVAGSNTFYDRKTTEKVELSAEDAKLLTDRAKKELTLSDNIIYGDLLRFYSGNKFRTGTMKTITDPEEH
ncbi:LTA synthase family protein [Bacillus sp. RG28]|uniref:LTA synthase family protein n=1 Tax=Gottfriedia endophytica TaxID=2820819 RepID=A0A940NSV3_9BACI|nr:LTA synthase family protein [Gottfriedia endophytica]MBP0727200.1 LTA synthase family protein [Gottfriedia endophytica]